MLVSVAVPVAVTIIPRDIEAVRHLPRIIHAVVVGIGVNVQWTDFPPEIAETATACNLVVGREVSRDALLDEFHGTLGLDRLSMIHLNDSKAELGSRADRHEHIGQGEIGIEGFRRLINDPRWAGIAMLLETPKEDDLKDDVENLARLCSLVADSERVPPGLRAEKADRN